MAGGEGVATFQGSEFSLTPVRHCESCRQDRTGSLSETGALFQCGHCLAVTIQEAS